MDSNNGSEPRERVIIIDLDAQSDGEGRQSRRCGSDAGDGSAEDDMDLGLDSTEIECFDDSFLEWISDESHQSIDPLDPINDDQNLDENIVKISENIENNRQIKSKKVIENLRLNKRKISELESEVERMAENARNLMKELNLTRIEAQKYRDICDHNDSIAVKRRIRCFCCGKTALREFFCCFNGQYCSHRCKSIDWSKNRHLAECLKSCAQNPTQSRFS